jgi:putative membrane protein
MHLLSQLVVTTAPTTAPIISEGKLMAAAVTSGLNATSTVLLLVALVLVKKRQYRAHAAFMVTALVTSALFLIIYLWSKYYFGEVTTKMIAGSAPKWAVALYLLVLIPHLIAAIGMLPMIFLAVNHAAHRRWDKHRRIAKPTWYVWFYVSVTGVLVYWMLYHWLPGLAAASA